MGGGLAGMGGRWTGGWEGDEQGDGREMDRGGRGLVELYLRPVCPCAGIRSCR